MAALALRTILFWPLSIRETLRILDMRPMAYFSNLRGPIGASIIMAAAMAAFPFFFAEGHSQLWILLAQISVGAIAYLAASAGLSRVQARELWAIL